MKSFQRILLILTLNTITPLFACIHYSETDNSHYVICQTKRALSLLKEMNQRHQGLSREEILTDIEDYVSQRREEITDPTKKYIFLLSAERFYEEIESLESKESILKFEKDLIADLEKFEQAYIPYIQLTNEVEESYDMPQALIPFIFASTIDLIAYPFQALINEVNYQNAQNSLQKVIFAFQ